MLQPTRLLQTRLTVDSQRPAESYEFSELIEKFVPDRNPIECAKLGLLKPNSYVGLANSVRSPGRQFVFLLLPGTGPGDLGQVLQRDPSFGERILCSYKVERTGYEGSVWEPEGRIEP